jgi:threonine aldolase
VIERQTQINMVFFRRKRYPLDDQELVEALNQRNIRINPPDDGIFRFACHYWTTREDLEHLVLALKELAHSKVN